MKSLGVLRKCSLNFSRRIEFFRLGWDYRCGRLSWTLELDFPWAKNITLTDLLSLKFIPFSKFSDFYSVRKYLLASKLFDRWIITRISGKLPFIAKNWRFVPAWKDAEDQYHFYSGDSSENTKMYSSDLFL